MNVHVLASTSVPFTLTTVQVPNIAQTDKKRIAVHCRIHSYTPAEYTLLPAFQPGDTQTWPGPGYFGFLFPVFRIRIQLGQWIQIRIQEGKNDPQK